MEMKRTLLSSLLLFLLNRNFLRVASSSLVDLTGESDDDKAEVSSPADEALAVFVGEDDSGASAEEDVFGLGIPISSGDASGDNMASMNLQYIANNLLAFTKANFIERLEALGPGEYRKSLKPGCKWNLLHESVYTDNVEIADTLIEHFGFDPNAWDPHFGTCAYLVCSRAMIKMLQARDTNFTITESSFMYTDPSSSGMLRGNPATNAVTDDFELRLGYMVGNLHAQQMGKPVLKFRSEAETMYRFFISAVSKFTANRQANANIEVCYPTQSGIDRGGLTKDFIIIMKNEMISQGQVFQEDRDTGVLSIKAGAPLNEVVCAGFLFGLSIYHQTPLNVIFSPIIYHAILAKNLHRDINFVSIARETSEEFKKAFDNIKRLPDEVLGDVEFPEIEGDKLKTWKRRRNFIESRENITEYIKISAKQLVYDQIAAELDKFVFGVGKAISCAEVATYLSPEELKVAIAGEMRDYTADEFFDNAESLQHQEVFPNHYQWLREIIDEMTPKQRALLLRFFTSYECLPIGGMANLSVKIKVEMIMDTRAEVDNYFPGAGTCFNSLKIYPYSTKEIMRTKLISAIEDHNRGFYTA